MRLHRMYLLVPLVYHLVNELGRLGLILWIGDSRLLLSWDVPVIGGRVVGCHTLRRSYGVLGHRLHLLHLLLLVHHFSSVVFLNFYLID